MKMPQQKSILDSLRRSAISLRTSLDEEDYTICDQAFALEGDRAERLLKKYGDVRQLSEIREIISKLDDSLASAAFPKGSVKERYVWSFATLKLRQEPLNVLRGFVQSTKTISLLPLPSTAVVEYLISLPDYKDFIERENHSHFGWHYHYLDRKKRRSNIIFCWDTIWNGKEDYKERPLFWEKHGDGRYQFDAHPRAWAQPKRTSIHRKCGEDSEKRSIKEFKHASKEAEAVWPFNATLTEKDETALAQLDLERRSGASTLAKTHRQIRR